MTTRRGFTMVELMIGLVLTLAVGGVTYQMLLNNQRITRTQTEKVGVQDNVRAGALIIANELRDVGYDAISAGASAELGGHPVGTRSDLLEIFKGTVKYHATRGLGFVCSVSAGAPSKVVVYRSSWQAFRSPRSTDTLMVYVESKSSTASDDAWIHLGIAGPPANANCPTVGGVTPPGLEFTVEAPTDLNLLVALGKVVLGGPARLTEVMRMSHWRSPSDGEWWLGMRSESVANDAMQPVVGPLTDSSTAAQGLAFVYRDADDAATAVAANVRSIEVTLVGLSDEPVRGRNVHRAMLDTLAITTRVTLRNTLR